MADSDVSITFSAQIGQALSGIEQMKSAIQSIAGPVDALAGVFTRFGSAFAGAFAIDQVASFVSQMEDLGTKTLRTSAMLGVSTTEAQELGFIAKATGTDTETLALSMERLQVNLQKAQSGTGPAAEALQALGLSAKSLIGVPLPEQMNRIADAVSKFADGGNKTAIVMALLGRSGAQMIPVLDQGRRGLEDLRQAAEDAGVVVSTETSKALDRAGTSSAVLKASVTALGEAIVGRLSKPLIDVTSNLTLFTSDLAALVQAGQLGSAVMTELGTAIKITEFNLINTAGVLADMAQPWRWGNILSDWTHGNAEIRRIQKESDDQLLMQAARTKLALEMEMKFGASGSKKPQAPALAVPNTDALNASMAAAQEQIRLADSVYQKQIEQYDSEFKIHLTTESQKTAATLAALEVRYNAELQGVSGELALYAAGTADYQKALNERTQLREKYEKDQQKILNQSIQEEAKQWDTAFSSIEGAFNSQLRGLLAGTTSWAAAMKSISGDLVIEFIEGAEKMVLQWISGEIAKTTATVAGVAVRTSAEEAGAATSLGTQMAAAMSAIAIDVGQVFANLAAWLTATLGPAGVPVALGVSAGVGALALSQIHHLDVGGYVVSPGLAMIHAGETVVPANVQTPFSGGPSGAGMQSDQSRHIGRLISSHETAMRDLVSSHKRSMSSFESEISLLHRTLRR